jgi:outer membrane lipoprotein carrier protein
MATDKLSASVTFLWGKGRLADEFSITKLDCPTCTGTLLELTPKIPDSRFKKVKLEVDPKQATVLRSIVVDPDGSENAITFTNLKLNTGVDDKAFVVQKPPGTQVMDFTKAAKP